jgi:hypothetical protein
MTRFIVYTNTRARRRRSGDEIQTVLRGVTSWLRGLLAALFRDAPGAPTSPGPHPKPSALFGGARLREDTDAVARTRAA